jgi:hypothetical protein
MPGADEIQRSLAGAWRLLMGDREGLRLLDLSVDGFWNSFFAIILALPALLVGWVAVSAEMAPGFGGRLGTVLALAIADLAAWIVPLIGLALAARPAGIADRFVAYVVASNWASALLVWLMLPPSLLALVSPGAGEVAAFLSLLLFLVALVLTWRLTNAVLDRGPAAATVLFVAMLGASLAVLLMLQSLFGISSAPAS